MGMIMRRLYFTDSIKSRIYAGLGISIILFSMNYWQNRYVEIHAVIVNEAVNRPIFFDNDMYKVLEREEAPECFYENIEFVLDHMSRDYIIDDGKVFIRYKLMKDLDMVMNFTYRTSDSIWLMEEVKEERLKLDLIEKSTGIKMKNRYIQPW